MECTHIGGKYFEVNTYGAHASWSCCHITTEHGIKCRQRFLDLFSRQVWWLATAFVSAMSWATFRFLIDRPKRFRGAACTGGGGWQSTTRACVAFRCDHIVLRCNDVARAGHCHGLYAAADQRLPDGHTTRHLVFLSLTPASPKVAIPAW